jgi:hypothetical protein
MSETHSRGDNTAAHPITGESPGIADILARRTAGELAGEELQSAEAEPRDDAAEAAAELASWRRRAETAEQQAAAERRRAETAERDRVAAVQGAEDTGFTAISTALAATQQSIATLKTEMKTAGEAGDFSRLADISAELGRLGGELRELERGKTEVERQRTDRLQDRPTQRQDRPADPIAGSETERAILRNLNAPSREAFLANRTPATREWLQANPQFFTDDAVHARIVAADSLAKMRGIPIDTPTYFDLLRKEAALDATQRDNTRQQRRDAAPGTPPSRDAPGPSGRTRTGDIYVTADQKTAAAWMGVDAVEYAEEQRRLEQRGEWPYRRR